MQFPRGYSISFYILWEFAPINNVSMPTLHHATRQFYLSVQSMTESKLAEIRKDAWAIADEIATMRNGKSGPLKDVQAKLIRLANRIAEVEASKTRDNSGSINEFMLEHEGLSAKAMVKLEKQGLVNCIPVEP